LEGYVWINVSEDFLIQVRELGVAVDTVNLEGI
jgi:hypothetical protein